MKLLFKGVVGIQKMRNGTCIDPLYVTVHERFIQGECILL